MGEANDNPGRIHLAFGVFCLLSTLAGFIVFFTGYSGPELKADGTLGTQVVPPFSLTTLLLTGLGIAATRELLKKHLPGKAAK